MPPSRALIVFVKNPQLGKVKTRLAKDIGDEKALEVYLQLLQHTLDATLPLPVDKLLYYSSFVDEADMWPATSYQKYVQYPSADLGERMHLAFEQAFAVGYQQVAIIGSDCPGLTTDLLNRAFEQLDDHDFVIGPANDGGYYLLGMKKLQKRLFEHKEWSTSNVMDNTLWDIKALQMTYSMLPMLNDIDNKEDLLEFQQLTPEV